jgi:hypothetical protein
MIDLEGFCSVQTGNIVAGWVRSPERPEEPLRVEIRTENGFSSLVTADLFQPELAAAHRHCGFRCELPAEIVDNGVKVYVSVPAVRRQVNNSPLILHKMRQSTTACESEPSWKGF